MTRVLKNMIILICEFNLFSKSTNDIGANETLSLFSISYTLL